MTGKANAVFWMGLILIALNFWVSGQSAVLWGAFTGTSGNVQQKPAQPPKKVPHVKHNPIGMR